MKNLLLMALVTFSMVTSCKKEEASNPSPTVATQISDFPIEPLNADELTSLLHMREEEKLAHDVYVTLYAKWGVPVFNNISKSEQTHTDAILTLIQRYQLVDPVGTHEVGVFEDSTLQTLYNQLVAKGSQSLLDAYNVGATIEDLDIFDLNNWVKKVDNQDILFVYGNLTKGSRNHMRSFYSQIISSGGTYTAQFITQAELEAIINSDKEMGSK
ncbi:MAG: DUF2202 domain-containing protein [Bacteroidia bacterium]|nr:DUF2202 domain-containing protein [Bacteroidia bacterium]MCF8428190.1 DUF2202 domain-containing protein [Bacteroidia bacterium]